MKPQEILSDQGNCRLVDSNVMYPEDNDRRAIAIAKSICENCCVIDLCRTEALAHKERGGIWAGLTERERDRLSRNIGREHGRRKRS